MLWNAITMNSVNLDEHKDSSSWLDLSPKEVTMLIMNGAADGGWQGFAIAISKALKEKNNV